MSDLVIKNARIVTSENKSGKPKINDEMSDIGVIENGFIAVTGSKIDFVEKGDGRDFIEAATQVIDAEGKLVMPGLVDSHTHLVHYGSRENELALKLNGASYLDILKAGGGILSTVRATREAERQMLTKKALKSLDIMLANGTTTIEGKSGYGLDFETEVKCLEVMRDINHHIEIVPTYMGAHAIPTEFKHDPEVYIDQIINKDIPYVASNKLCEYIDCFCEHGVFSVEQTRRILMAGREHGLKLKLHADEIESLGGAELAAELKATSAEHLIAASDEGIVAMAKAGVIAVLLPATAFYLRIGRYARAKDMIKAGVPVAISTDYNPGSSPTESLLNAYVFASMGMGLTPRQIITASTINAAYAIGRADTIGSIEKGKQADIVIMDAPNEDYIVYHFGINHVNTVIKKGKVVVKR